MNRGQVLEYMRNVMDTINSNISPAYMDNELYPFLDRAQILEVDNSIDNKNLDVLRNIIKKEFYSAANITEMAVSDGFTANEQDQFPVYVSLNDLNDAYYGYLSSSIKLSRPNDTINQITDTNPKWVSSELKHFVQAENYLVTPFNKPYFRKPKCYIDNNNEHLVILPDYWMKFYSDDNTVYITYVTMPTSFANMTDDTIEPDLPEKTHYDIATKAAQFANTSIDPQSTATEVQVDEKVKQDSEDQRRRR